jgi:hypothetical protein
VEFTAFLASLAPKGPLVLASFAIQQGRSSTRKIIDIYTHEETVFDGLVGLNATRSRERYLIIKGINGQSPFLFFLEDACDVF